MPASHGISVIGLPTIHQAEKMPAASREDASRQAPAAAAIARVPRPEWSEMDGRGRGREGRGRGGPPRSPPAATLVTAGRLVELPSST